MALYSDNPGLNLAEVNRFFQLGKMLLEKVKMKKKEARDGPFFQLGEMLLEKV